MTKAEEITQLNGIIKSLPDSYLRDLLNHLQMQFESDVRADIPTLPDIRKLELATDAAKKDCETAYAKLRGIVEQVRVAEIRLAHLERITSTARNEAHSLGRDLAKV
mgnify:CR=1 FL=1